MIVFIDFEASSLARHSYPIEVAWVFEDGASEAHLIRPVPDWTDWDAGAEAIHHIARDTLLRDGTAHDEVARRMVEVLTGHDLTASAPSWDGKWLSALLRAAGLPRHSLRLRDTEEVQRDAVRAILAGHLPPERMAAEAERLIADAATAHESDQPAHRALADARQEWTRWREIKAASERYRNELVQGTRTASSSPHENRASLITPVR